MALFGRLFRKRGGRGGLRKGAVEGEGRLKGGGTVSGGSLFRRRIKLFGLTTLFASAVVLICFVGQDPPALQASGEVAPENVYSDRVFTFTSEFKRKVLAQLVSSSTDLEYARDFEGEKRFEKAIGLLQEGVGDSMDKAGESLRLARESLRDELRATYGLALSLREIRAVSLVRNETGRRALFDDLLENLGHLHATGVLLSPSSHLKFISEANATALLSKSMRQAANDLPVIGGVDEGLELLFDLGEVKVEHPHFARYVTGVRESVEEDGPFPAEGLTLGAVVDTADENASREATLLREELGEAFTDLARRGLFLRVVDHEGTREARERKIAATSPERYEVTVREGELLLRKGEEVTEEAWEKYGRYLEITANERDLMPQRILITFATFLFALLYVNLVLPDFWSNDAKTGIVAAAVLGNLLLARGILELGGTEMFGESALLLGLLPHLSPVAFASMVVMITVGPRMAALSALMTSIFLSAMQDTGLATLAISLGAALTGAFFCRDVRLRASVLKAGAMSGLTAAFLALALGVVMGNGPAALLNHSVAALLTGVLTGALCLGALPLFEQGFKLATDLTLFELTDFNHPLLRRMQVEAPGTYHHSLMVANLSENAAVAVGAKSLLCRTCSLYHDIGKMKQPEYFTENQTDHGNPHSRRNPAMSALIIKSHVKEGVEMARERRLPKVVIDVIRQHHGTTLVKYFYHEAQKQHRQEKAPSDDSQEADPPDESTYRYDGPKPRFRESAIIFFADSVEAAARSLRKVTKHSVEELLDAIFAERLEDGQLDQCPLTLEEVALIKASFTKTLLNMLHSRIEYPDDEKPKKKDRERGGRERRSRPENTNGG